MPEVWTPIERLIGRRARALAECPDTMEHFSSNLWLADVVTKLATCTVIGAIEHADSDRISDRSYRLSRANSGGDWMRELDGCLKDDLRRIPAGTDVAVWINDLGRYLIQVGKRPDADALEAVARPVFSLRSSLLHNLEPFRRPTPLSLLTWCVDIRNKTIGHGALGAGFWEENTRTLSAAIDYLLSGIPLFLPDLFVVVPGPTLDSCGRVLRGQEPRSTIPVDNLDVGTAGCKLVDEEWSLPALAWIRTSDNHTFLANGSWRGGDRSAELLCHAIAATEGEEGKVRRQLPAYAIPPTSALGASETEGSGALDVSGAIVHNLPLRPEDYVRRPQLESELTRVLSDTAKRHLVNVKGIGGIGKTSLILSLAHGMLASERCPYAQLIWVSARDVDLTLRGPKAVRKAAGHVEELWALYANLWGLDSASGQERFEADLADPKTPTLLIMDNFETFDAQEEAYHYLDEVVQPPSKVLITSRHDFKGDFQVQVRGMEPLEASQLIRSAARGAGREGLIDEQVIARICDKTQGHPYAMKLLATSVESKAGLVSLLASVFGDERLLDALFRRSMADVGEEAEFLFLLASRFPAGVSEPALRVATAPEDIALAPGLQTLRQRSLIEADESTGLYVMPAMAREFAKRIAVGHIHGVAIDEAERYLKAWPGLVLGRIDDAARSIEASVRTEGAVKGGRNATETLSLLAEYDERAWVRLARALAASGGDAAGIDEAYKRAVEADPEAAHVFNEWADAVIDPDRRIQLKVQAVTADPTNFKLASNVAQLLNALRARDKARYTKLAWTSLMEPVATVMEGNAEQLDANDCSRLAWLHLNLARPGAAKRAVRRGRNIDEDNYNIVNLAERLEIV